MNFLNMPGQLRSLRNKRDRKTTIMWVEIASIFQKTRIHTSLTACTN